MRKFLTLAGFLLLLLWLQMTLGPYGILGWDWSLCGLMVLSLSLRSPSYQYTGMGLGLVRDSLSLTPLGAQAFCMGLTAVAVHFLGGLVFLESFWIQGIIFFLGYVFFEVSVFLTGRLFGFLTGGFWDIFLGMLPKAAGAAVFCWMLSGFASRMTRRRYDY